MNALEEDDPEACDELKSGAFLGQNLRISSRISLGSQAEKKEAKETVMVDFAQKSLGRCRMTCSFCESVLQSTQVVRYVTRRDCFDYQSKCP